MGPAIHRLMGKVPGGWRRSLKRLPGATWIRDRLYGAPRGRDPRPGDLRPVVYLPTWVRWNHMPQRPQFMLEAFARSGHDVWVVDPTLASTRRVNDRITLVGSVQAVPGTHVLLYTHFAPLVTQLKKFEEPAVVYDLMDDLAIYDEDEIGLPEERRVRHHHSTLAERADVMVVSNAILAERHRGERPDLIHIENGVDLERFNPHVPVAPELARRPGVVGYHGAIAQWFDFETMAAIARGAPDLAFVLVGPVDPRAASDLARLLALPNVEHIPEQPGEKIPGFVRGFSVGLIPFAITHMTEGVTPLKMYEYMASCVPVVATPLPACVEHPAVFTAADAPTLVEGIRAGIAMPRQDRDQLINHAKEASWDMRIVPLLTRLEELDKLHVSHPGPN